MQSECESMSEFLKGFFSVEMYRNSYHEIRELIYLLLSIVESPRQCSTIYNLFVGVLYSTMNLVHFYYCVYVLFRFIYDQLSTPRIKWMQRIRSLFFRDTWWYTSPVFQNSCGGVIFPGSSG